MSRQKAERMIHRLDGIYSYLGLSDKYLPFTFWIVTGLFILIII